jgi:hypothetical protein
MLDGLLRTGPILDGLNIGSKAQLEICICADCGQMTGNWPLPLYALRTKNEQP